MNKNDLCNDVYNTLGQELNLSKNDVNNVVSSVFNLIEGYLQNGEDVTIQSFGKWSVVTKKARKGRNPKTGAELMIPEKKSVKFAVSSKIKEGLNA